MMTGTLSPRSLSLGRTMSTLIRSFLPSPSESTVDCTRTYSLMASWYEKTGCVPSAVTLMEGFCAAWAAAGIPAAARAAVTASETRALRCDGIRMHYLLGGYARNLPQTITHPQATFTPLMGIDLREPRGRLT